MPVEVTTNFVTAARNIPLVISRDVGKLQGVWFTVQDFAELSLLPQESLKLGTVCRVLSIPNGNEFYSWNGSFWESYEFLVGSGGGTPTEKILKTDFISEFVHYVGYSTKIVKIVYDVQIQKLNYPTLDLESDWPNRETLTYA